MWNLKNVQDFLNLGSIDSCEVCDETKTKNDGNEATHENRQIISCILIKTILMTSDLSITVLWIAKNIPISSR